MKSIVQLSNILAADGLVTSGARTSAGMVLTWFPQNNMNLVQCLRTLVLSGGEYCPNLVSFVMNTFSAYTNKEIVSVRLFLFFCQG